jgi:N6-adenosine-specific RNA methylase IME4
MTEHDRWRGAEQHFATSRKGRPPIGKTAMTAAERQRRHRAKLAKKANRQRELAARRLQARADYEARAVAGGTVVDLVALAKSGARFSVIYADPPWEFKTYSGKGKQRSAERYYDTSSLDAIKALPIADLAAPDCRLFLWGVMPETPGALEVIKAWGFEFKTAGFVWVKQNRSGEGLFTGMGYHTRANAEICWLATRGSPMRMDLGVHSIVLAPVGAHSAKPEEVRRRIERLCVGPYLELFGRCAVPGWTVFGNEVEALSVAAE